MFTIDKWMDTRGTVWFGLFGRDKETPAAIFGQQCDAERMQRKLNAPPPSTGDIDHWKGLGA